MASAGGAVGVGAFSAEVVTLLRTLNARTASAMMTSTMTTGTGILPKDVSPPSRI